MSNKNYWAKHYNHYSQFVRLRLAYWLSLKWKECWRPLSQGSLLQQSRSNQSTNYLSLMNKYRWYLCVNAGNTNKLKSTFAIRAICKLCHRTDLIFDWTFFLQNYLGMLRSNWEAFSIFLSCHRNLGLNSVQ